VGLAAQVGFDPRELLLLLGACSCMQHEMRLLLPQLRRLLLLLLLKFGQCFVYVVLLLQLQLVRHHKRAFHSLKLYCKLPHGVCSFHVLRNCLLFSSEFFFKLVYTSCCFYLRTVRMNVTVDQ
jgi:hypothetical protein